MRREGQPAARLSVADVGGFCDKERQIAPRSYWWKRSASSARMIAPTCAHCWPRSRTAACCAFRATRISPSPPASPVPRSTATPLRRVGAKGEGKFALISWDEALDEIVSRWKAIIAESGPLALLGYAYSAHQGQLNRGLVLGLFHALGASRLTAGTVCDTCCETAWDMTVGPVGGADPESVEDSDLIISWGADLVATNVHFWAKVEQARKRGVPVVVIDPRRSRTARLADCHLTTRTACWSDGC